MHKERKHNGSIERQSSTDIRQENNGYIIKYLTGISSKCN